MELFQQDNSTFPLAYQDIINRVSKINPVKYVSDRNYINGSVTYLSPYISRGVISTKFILAEILNKGHHPGRIQKFIQELAWRDYWQQVWIAKGNSINEDIKHAQSPVSNTEISIALTKGETGINSIDHAIKKLYETGYMHNHWRMYVASIACNIAESQWKVPAQWMYYHLLDADWASNALSWQWVAGANANKKYVANQENINKYCFQNQTNTFLDVPYDRLLSMKIPEILMETSLLELKTPLPKNKEFSIDANLPTLIYNFYNLDPNWKKEELSNKVLLLEPSKFQQYPVSQKTIDFTINLAEKNIPAIKIFVGEFEELVQKHKLKEIYFKEHPLNINYKGKEEKRDWMFEVDGYYPSFFAFWKKCRKQLAY